MKQFGIFLQNAARGEKIGANGEILSARRQNAKALFGLDHGKLLKKDATWLLSLSLGMKGFGNVAGKVFHKSKIL
jgi:hypothetical protein